MNEINTIAAFVSVAIAVSTILSVWRAKARRRAAELKAAKHALEVHYGLVNEVMGDPALPERMASVLAGATIMASSPEATAGFLEAFLSRGRMTGSARLDESDALRKSRPDLYEKWVRAMMSGAVGAILRWENTAGRFAEFSAELAGDAQRERQVASRITELKRSLFDNNNSNHPTGGGLPAPA